jgi:hypothetical protein
MIPKVVNNTGFEAIYMEKDKERRERGVEGKER